MQKLKLKIVFQFLNKIYHCVDVRICKIVLVILLLLLVYHQPLGSTQHSASTQLLHNLAANVLPSTSASCCRIAID